MSVQTILGCGRMGPRLDLEEGEKMVQSFYSFMISQKHKNNVSVDSAFQYGKGKTDEYLGQMSCKDKIKISGKANPWDGKGLGKESVRMQLETTLKRLQLSSLGIFYLHAPDHKTSISDTLATVDELHKEGKFEEFGLSNYAAWQVAEIYTICKHSGWILPTVYQGMYNCLTRSVEKELFPCIRYFKMRFYAYNPRCGGVLTGKHNFEEVNKNEPGRFFGNGERANIYRKRFWKDENFKAVDDIKRILNEVYGEGKVSITEAVFRWLYHHSLLDGNHGDGVIIGASTMEQFDQNISYVKGETMDERVVDVIENCWLNVKYSASDYFR